MIIVIVAEREDKREEADKENEKSTKEENEGREKEEGTRERKEERRERERGSLCRFKTSPCVGSERLRVYGQNARMCTY